MNFKYYIIVLYCVFNQNSIYSQACCSGGVPLGSSMGMGTANKGAWQALLTYDYNNLSSLMTGDELFEDDTRQRITHSGLLELNYGISERFTMMLMLPYIRQERSIKRNNSNLSNDFTSTNGFGDVLLLLKYRIVSRNFNPSNEWILGAGPNLANARTDFRNNTGLVLPADMQPGSGSYDAVFWSYFQQDRLWKSNFSIMNITSYRLSGTNPNYFGSQRYSFGNEFQNSYGVSYRFIGKQNKDVFTLFRYRQQGNDLVNGEPFPSSGGKWLHWVPGVNYHLSKNFYFGLSGDVPIYRYVDGAQLATTFKITSAIFWNINFKTDKNENYETDF